LDVLRADTIALSNIKCFEIGGTLLLQDASAVAGKGW
jgi:hypothetical protein